MRAAAAGAPCGPGALTADRIASINDV